MRYADQGTSRYKDGSLAENETELIVEAYFQSIGRPLERYGSQGADTSQAIVTTWPSNIRHTPDYCSFAKFIEVKSCWGDAVKIKYEDLEALEFWNRQMPVWFAIYQARDKRLILADLPSIKWAAAQEGTETITFDKGTKAEKLAYQIPLTYLVDEQRVKDAMAAAKAHPIPDHYVGV